MNAYSLCSATGLALDIIGVALVFFFPILSSAQLNVVLYDDPSPEQVRENKKIKFWAHMGFGLIVVGFTLQLIGTIGNAQ